MNPATASGGGQKKRRTFSGLSDRGLAAGTGRDAALPVGLVSQERR
ncbi:hypothetical protein ABZ079_28170 [Streptomyces sp. NPDC006314]